MLKGAEYWKLTWFIDDKIEVLIYVKCDFLCLDLLTLRATLNIYSLIAVLLLFNMLYRFNLSSICPQHYWQKLQEIDSSFYSHIVSYKLIK